MDLLVPFALKSLLIAGVTLGLLHLLRRRSAAERSMVAHVGLVALLMVPVGSMFLPQLVIEAPILNAPPATPTITAGGAAIPTAPVVAADAPLADAFDPASLWPLAYGLPVALLLAVTLLAVLRLLTLRARASVLVEPSWLSALAHAQRRMNFKHGTALLTSGELRSPISWGVLRPVILLNEEALEARGEAEAIIAHELAHVRGLDWAKLLLARIVVAIFWFNPLVWILSREAHQLREETADDAVLAANVASTDYAQLLVGVARHDCRGLLLGAHGVAPGKGSLSRRVRRVLDASLPRTPVARGFAAGIALGVVGTAAPLAALTFTPAGSSDGNGRYYVGSAEPRDTLPAVVAQSVVGATARTSEAVTAHVAAALAGGSELSPAAEQELERRVETQIAYSHPHPGPAPMVGRDRAVERAIAAKAIGITPDYAARIRAAAPALRIDEDELVGMRAVGITPEWLGEMVRSGYSVRDADDLTGARAVGIDGAYVADLAAAGLRGVPLEDLTAMRALGIDGRYIRKLQAAGMTRLSPDRLIELRAHGIGAATVRRPHAVRPPALPRVGVPGRADTESPELPDPPEPPDEDWDHDPDHGE